MDKTQFPKLPPVARWETFTSPEIRRILAASPNYRALSASRVELLRNDMLAGKWLFDGATVRFDAEGRLIDGQHRFAAAAAAQDAGVPPVHFLVVRGVPRAAEHVIDTGKPRCLADVLRNRLGADAPNLTVQAAVTRVLALLLFLTGSDVKRLGFFAAKGEAFPQLTPVL